MSMATGTTEATASGRAAYRRRRVENAIIRLVFGLAFTYLIVSIVGLVVTLVRTVSSGQFDVRLPIDLGDSVVGFHYAGSATVESTWPSPDATFTISHVSAGLVTLFAVQAILVFVIQAVIASSIVVLSYQTLERRPFVRALTTLLYVVAAVLAVVGSGLEVLQIAINHQTMSEITGGDPNTPLGSFFSWTFTGTWILVGFGVAAVAILFQIGSRMQRDTEGLV